MVIVRSLPSTSRIPGWRLSTSAISSTSSGVERGCAKRNVTSWRLLALGLDGAPAGLAGGRVCVGTGPAVVAVAPPRAGVAEAAAGAAVAVEAGPAGFGVGAGAACVQATISRLRPAQAASQRRGCPNIAVTVSSYPRGL